MSVIEALNDNYGSVPREVVGAFVEDLASLAARLSPEAQARLMGLVHLVEDPGAIQAELEVSASGEITLVLRHPPGR
jgi:hypothetical protein